MSFSPSLSLVRLQELKLWQGSYENLIQKSKISSQQSDYDHLEGVSVLDNSNAGSFSPEEAKMYPKDWDKKAISPCKPFEQLLEEKLAEDTPMEGDTKPKKPFLRKGQGLARFRMRPTPPVKNHKNKGITSKTLLRIQKKVPSPIPQQKTPHKSRKGILKNNNPLYHQYVDLSPLTVPDFVKPRGTWKSVFENYEKDFKKDLLQENVDGEQDDINNYKDFGMSLRIRENAAKSVGELDRNDEGDDHDMFTKLSRKEKAVEDYEEFRMSLGYGENLPKSGAKIYGINKVEDHGHDIFPKLSGRQVEDIPNGDGEVENKEDSLSKDNLEIFNKKIMEKINEYAQKYFKPAKTFLSNDIPETIADSSTPKFKRNGAGDLTLYEEKMERELKIFEVLEKKVENSSFCSTNTSIANLLASTPQKAPLPDTRNHIFEGKDSSHSLELSDNIEFTNDRHENIQLKLREVAEKTDVLQHFLINLRKMEDKGVQQGNFSLDSDLTKKSTSTNTSFSEENTRWSTRSPSLTDNYTEYDTTCQSDSWKKIDAGVNTSFDGTGLDETVKKLEPCKDCEELRSKFSDTKMKFSDVKSENSNLKMDLRESEKKYEQMKKDMKKNKEHYQEMLENLQEELEKERKKFVKEKTYFENYVKESQNRTTKKEREEITQLKQELIDSKELLKLKDAKNGASQARLRTQIKQQEKEICELKISVEKLQKENAKLTASQKFMRRPQEVKMLHEINKNLSKLTEETFKKHVNKSGSSDFEENDRKDLARLRKKSESCVVEDVCSKENEKYGKNVSNKEVQKNVLAIKDSIAALDLTNSGGLSIEKRYEEIFGNFSSPRNSNVSTDLEKIEKTLPDGSTEISYSNGNLKTLSADGHVIVIKYFNGDTKETNIAEQIIRYHYAATDSWHVQYSDGTEVMEYKDGQKCKKYADGKTEVTYNDGAVRIINADGTEEQQFPDGRKTLKNLQGEQVILLPNGQREIHTREYKRREYPDGTIRTLRKDGSVETVYSNGRVRLKDSNGVLLMDTHQSPQS